ncbi:hypothetical protein IWQ61_005261 [Dispira simplex]|nr:hypothetical protein IWQ61_005261 [Dispira simplex]
MTSTHTTSVALHETNLDRVTVYQNQALLVRHVRVPLISNEEDSQRYRVKVQGLPGVLQVDSVRMKLAPGVSATLVDIATRPLSSDESTSSQEMVLALRKRVNGLKWEQTLLQNELDLVEKFASSASLCPTSATTSTHLVTNNVQAIQEFTGYYRTSCHRIGEQRRKLDEEINILQEQLDHTVNNTWENGQDALRQYQVEAVVECPPVSATPEPIPLDMTLILSYVVSQVSWEALYDLRAFTDTRALDITYLAEVSQKTGENWDNVTMELSTALPHQGSSPPTLNEWLIFSNSIQTKSASSAFGGVSRSGRRPAAPGLMSVMGAPKSSAVAMTMSEPRVEFQPPVPTITSRMGLTSTTFILPSSVTLPSDGEKHRVTIGHFRAEATFKHFTVPKLSPRVFLQARIKNTSTYVLLPGLARIFCDRSFVTITSLNHVSPTEYFTCFFGADPSVRVTYAPAIKEKSTSKGFMSSQATLQMTQSIEVHNTKHSTTVYLVVQDQLPLSSEDKCTVKLVEPRADLVKEGEIDSEDTTALAPDDSIPISSPRRLSQSLAKRQVTNSSPASTTPTPPSHQDTPPMVLTGPHLPLASRKPRGSLVWSLCLAPNDKQIIQFKYEVKHPASEVLLGFP